MILAHIDMDDLLRFVTVMGDQLPERTRTSAAAALNEVGEGLVREVAQYISGQTDMEPGVVRDLIQVSEADPRNLTWSMDASTFAPPSMDWSRPWVSRGTLGADNSQLIRVITMGDDRVCPICEEAAAEGPYTIEELHAKYPHTGDGLLHIGCRCGIQSWQSNRRLPVMFSGARSGPPELRTLRQLARMVSREFVAKLRVVP